MFVSRGGYVVLCVFLRGCLPSGLFSHKALMSAATQYSGLNTLLISSWACVLNAHTAITSLHG